MEFINLNRTIKVAAISSAFLASFATQAVLSDAVTAEANVTFTEALTISHSLTPTTGLGTGSLEADTVVATGTINTLSGAITRHYVGFGTSASMIGNTTTTVTGTNDSSNTILVKVALDTTIGGSGSSACSFIGVTCTGGTNVIFRNPSEEDGLSTYTVTLSGAQTVVGDTYNIQTVAYGYSA